MAIQSPSTESKAYSEFLLERTCSLWQDKRLMDYTIQAGGRQFKVHKVSSERTSKHWLCNHKCCN